MFEADDPVFGGGVYRVESCSRVARSKDMCQSHHLRWVREERPNLALFATTTDPRQRPPAVSGPGRCQRSARARRTHQATGLDHRRSGGDSLLGVNADPPVE
ncbi:MAG: hypothetical protein ACQEXM_29345, partial [Actinomycetota bacterium]